MRRFVMAAVGVALVCALAGCGASGGEDADEATTTKATPTTKATSTTSDDGPPTTLDDDVADATAEDYGTAMAKNLSSGDPATDLVLTEEQAACVGPKFVDAITVRALQEADLTPDDVADPDWDTSDMELTQAQGSDMVDAFEPCDVDIYAKFAEALSGGMTEEQQACIAENVDEAKARKLLVVTFAGGEGTTEFEAVLDDLTTACDLPPD